MKEEEAAGEGGGREERGGGGGKEEEETSGEMTASALFEWGWTHTEQKVFLGHPMPLIKWNLVTWAIGFKINS